jgi:hypothetical protein
VLRGILNAVPLSVLLLGAVGLTLAVVILAVWVIRRTVPETREGFHAEISAPMLGVVAALFGLILAFVIIIAYENFLEASADVSREADAVASIVRDSAAFSEPEGDRVRGAVGKYVHSVSRTNGRCCARATTALRPRMRWTVFSTPCRRSSPNPAERRASSTTPFVS